MPDKVVHLTETQEEYVARRDRRALWLDFAKAALTGAIMNEPSMTFKHAVEEAFKYADLAMAELDRREKEAGDEHPGV